MNSMNITGVAQGLNIDNISAVQGEVSAASFSEAISRAAENNDSSAIRAAAKQMESLFIYQMFQAMRRTVPESEGFFERSNAERIFTEMLDEEKANIMAKAGGIGIADAIYRELTR